MNIFFPHNDLYYGPCISTKKLIKVDGMSRLTFAIMYLQVSRVEELLNGQKIDFPAQPNFININIIY
jgi:hypothetical protein